MGWHLKIISLFVTEAEKRSSDQMITRYVLNLFEVRVSATFSCCYRNSAVEPVFEIRQKMATIIFLNLPYSILNGPGDFQPALRAKGKYVLLRLTAEIYLWIGIHL